MPTSTANSNFQTIIGYLHDKRDYRIKSRYFKLSDIYPIFEDMIAVITGDIINSRRLKKPSAWLNPVKKLLNTYGKSPESWEIYRGDSFQVEIKNPEEALFAALRIKAAVKSIKDLDVRMAIGIGKKEYSAAKITESNGDAFIHSGEKLETLKKEKQTLALKTPWADFDREMNLLIRLGLVTMDNWSTGAAELVSTSLHNPKLNQQEISRLLDISQSSVSERQKRSSLPLLLEMEEVYREKLSPLLAAV